MTEAEWLRSDDSWLMRKYLGNHASPRKLRLFACARCRHFFHLLSDERSQAAVEVAERFADQQATSEELQTASESAWRADASARTTRRATRARVVPSVVAENEPSGESIWDTAWDAVPDEEELAALLSAAEHEGPFIRDLFGNPFKPISLDSARLAPGIKQLAESIYADRAFDRLPILADALEEAGCTNADILAHCRGPGPHVRGCWVVDLLTGRQ